MPPAPSPMAALGGVGHVSPMSETIRQTPQQRSSVGCGTLRGQWPRLCLVPGWEPQQRGLRTAKRPQPLGRRHLFAANSPAAGQAVQPVLSSCVGRQRLVCWLTVRVGIASAQPRSPSDGGRHPLSPSSCAGKEKVRSHWIPSPLPVLRGRTEGPSAALSCALPQGGLPGRWAAPLRPVLCLGTGLGGRAHCVHSLRGNRN